MAWLQHLNMLLKQMNKRIVVQNNYSFDTIKSSRGLKEAEFIEETENTKEFSEIKIEGSDGNLLTDGYGLVPAVVEHVEDVKTPKMDNAPIH